VRPPRNHALLLESVLKMPSATRALLQTARAALAFVTAYAAHDAAGDAALYVLCKREAERRLAATSRVQASLGEPVGFGPWWDASVTVSHGHIVTAQYVLRGPLASADLRVGVVRPRGAEQHWTSFSNALYSSPLGPQPGWHPLLCEVTLPGGGMAERVDLLAVPKATREEKS